MRGMISFVSSIGCILAGATIITAFTPAQHIPNVGVASFRLPTQRCQSSRPVSRPLRKVSRCVTVVPVDNLDAEGQWDLFRTNHVGRWEGVWETFNPIGDNIGTVEAIFDVSLEDDVTATMSQAIRENSVSSDCETCHDSTQERWLPLGQVGTGALRRMTCAGPAMVNGPTVLRSGALSTELGLRFGDSRVRVTFQHIPAWEGDSTAGIGPPDCLDLFRVVMRRETLRDAPPTRAQAEADRSDDKYAGGKGAVDLWRGFPPFQWAQLPTEPWRGTHHVVSSQQFSDVPTTVNEDDAASWLWHEYIRGDDGDGSGTSQWHLRLPGGVLIQCPRRIPRQPEEEGGASAMFRLAWLAESTSLVRASVGVCALEEEDSGGDDDMLSVRLKPPSIVSFSADELERSPESEAVAALTVKPSDSSGVQ